MTTPNADALAARLDRLERQNRWLKVAGLITVAFLCSFGYGLANLSLRAGESTRPVPAQDGQRVVAREFVLNDAAGRTRAALNCADGAVRLYFVDESGATALGLSSSANGSGLGFHNVGGNGRLILTFDRSKGRACLAFIDSGGKPRAGLTGGDGDGSSLVFSDKDGKTRLELSGGGDGAFVRLSDANAKVRAAMGGHSGNWACVDAVRCHRPAHPHHQRRPLTPPIRAGLPQAAFFERRKRLLPSWYYARPGRWGRRRSSLALSRQFSHMHRKRRTVRLPGRPAPDSQREMEEVLAPTSAANWLWFMSRAIMSRSMLRGREKSGIGLYHGSWAERRICLPGPVTAARIAEGCNHIRRCDSLHNLEPGVRKT